MDWGLLAPTYLSNLYNGHLRASFTGENGMGAPVSALSELSPHKGGNFHQPHFTKQGPLTESNNNVPRSQAKKVALSGLEPRSAWLWAHIPEHHCVIWRVEPRGNAIFVVQNGYQLFYEIKECAWHCNF